MVTFNSKIKTLVKRHIQKRKTLKVLRNRFFWTFKIKLHNTIHLHQLHANGFLCIIISDNSIQGNNYCRDDLDLNLHDYSKLIYILILNT